ncbi:MAG: hypothetical protein EZS28_026028, partial [Streblomastix strix]
HLETQMDQLKYVQYRVVLDFGDLIHSVLLKKML